jgi:hypothetical protein
MEVLTKKYAEMVWRYEVAPHGKTVMLLTTGGVSTKGKWEGDYGVHYKAWYPLPKRDKELEKKLGLI